MLELSRFDGQLDVMVVTSKPAALMQIDAVEETEKETRIVVLKCEGPSAW